MNAVLFVLTALLAVPIALIVPPVRSLRKLGLRALEVGVNVAIVACVAAAVLFTLRLVQVPDLVGDLAREQLEQLPLLRALEGPLGGPWLLLAGSATLGGVAATVYLRDLRENLGEDAVPAPSATSPPEIEAVICGAEGGGKTVGVLLAASAVVESDLARGVVIRPDGPAAARRLQRRAGEQRRALATAGSPHTLGFEQIRLVVEETDGMLARLCLTDTVGQLDRERADEPDGLALRRAHEERLAGASALVVAVPGRPAPGPAERQEMLDNLTLGLAAVRAVAGKPGAKIGVVLALTQADREARSPEELQARTNVLRYLRQRLAAVAQLPGVVFAAVVPFSAMGFGPKRHVTLKGGRRVCLLPQGDYPRPWNARAFMAAVLAAGLVRHGNQELAQRVLAAAEAAGGVILRVK